MSKAVAFTIEAIQQLIGEQLKPADRLPSEKELVERLGVSRSTVRDALSRLEVEGVVERQWGIGTFVRSRPRSAFGIMSIRPGVPGLLATTGGVPSVHSFQCTEGPPDPEQFPSFPESPVLRSVRVFALDGVPAVAIRDWIPRDLDGQRLDVARLGSVEVLVADVLAAIGIDFKTLDVEMWAADLDSSGRLLFDLSRPEPVIETKGQGYDAQGRQILVARGTYRTSVIAMRLTVS